jgi:hypothetical protein
VRNPYVTGAYVAGHRHYGREALIDHLLYGNSHAYWVIGTRRSGKTSLLRQLEALTSVGEHFIPLFWDLQGSDDFARLGQYLADEARDHSKRFESLGMSAGVVPEDVLEILGTLRRSAAKARRELLLLCDETEALLKIARAEPEATQRLHRELTGGDGLRVVMTSTRTIYQMHDICANWPTSPFLDGFDVSLTLGSLTAESACALIAQGQTPPGGQWVRAEPEVVDTIADYTNCHPYLLQVLCSRLFQDDGTLRSVTERDLVVDPMVRGFLNHDFNSLTAVERQILLRVGEAGLIEARALQETVDEPSAEVHRHIYDLENLGFLRCVHAGSGGQIAVGNRFLANWLSLRPISLQSRPAAGASETAMLAALSRQQLQGADFLISRLNERRDRLVELEAVRAQDLLSVSPQVLTEIERIQHEIRQLRRSLDELQAG